MRSPCRSDTIRPIAATLGIGRVIVQIGAELDEHAANKSRDDRWPTEPTFHRPSECCPDDDRHHRKGERARTRRFNPG